MTEKIGSRWAECNCRLTEYSEDGERTVRTVTLEVHPTSNDRDRTGWARLQVSGPRINRHEMECFDRIAAALEELQNGPSAEDRGFTFCPACLVEWRAGNIEDPEITLCGIDRDNRMMCQACQQPFGEPLQVVSLSDLSHAADHIPEAKVSSLPPAGENNDTEAWTADRLCAELIEQAKRSHSVNGSGLLLALRAHVEGAGRIIYSGCDELWQAVDVIANQQNQESEAVK